VAYYFLQEISEFTVLKGEYLMDGWNIVDWANLILILTWVAFRVILVAMGGTTVVEDMGNNQLYRYVTTAHLKYRRRGKQRA
jgi:hypothetical protein